MRFAAGLTVSGIVGFLVFEILKLLLPTLAAWTAGLLGIALKLVLGVLIVAGVILGIGAVFLLVFLYRRWEKGRAEA